MPVIYADADAAASRLVVCYYFDAAAFRGASVPPPLREAVSGAAAASFISTLPLMPLTFHLLSMLSIFTLSPLMLMPPRRCQLLP